VSAKATQFREWLIVQLQRTRWVHLKEPVEQTAERLGVRVEILIEAKRRYAQNVERGRLGGGLISEATELVLKVPEALHQRWCESCEDLQLESGAVFRTLVHMLLMARENPSGLHEEWLVAGQRFKIGSTRNKAWPWRIRTTISRGAKSALRIRAERGRVTETALVRAKVIEFLEGKIVRLEHVFTAEQMHSSADKYWLGEQQ
jgi:hypothetical protein